jgi:hypothetical protein
MNKTQIVLRTKYPIVNLETAHYLCLGAPRTARSFRRGSEVFFRLGAYKPSEISEIVDPPLREITNAFLAVATVADAVDFLSRYGPLNPPPPRDPYKYPGFDPRTVKWSEFLTAQDDFREMWKLSPEELSRLNRFDTYSAMHFYLEIHDGRFYLLAVSDSVIDALTTDLIFTALSGLRSGFCARADCNRLFQKTTKHDRKYCSLECAHVESVRKHRARKSTGKMKGK